MNKTYRSIFNTATGTWVAASETAKSRRKSGGQRTLARVSVVLAAVTLSLGATQSFAYVAGTGAQQGNANNTVIGDNANGSAAGCNSTYLPGSACSTIIGNSASSTAGATTVIGDHASATGSNSTAIGAYASAAQWSQAIGAGAAATGGWATAIGQSAQATATNTTAIGTNSTALGNGATALGSGAHATQQDSFAMGWNANATAQGSMAFGTSVTSAGVNAVALGMGAKTTANDSVALGSASVADRANTISVGAQGSERQVVNMAAGVADTDAVNVSQLKPVLTGLGGGASIDPATGVVTGPTYKVQGGTQDNVGAALDALNDGVNDRVAYDKNGDGSTNYNSVTLGNGLASGPVALHNVAPGVADLDAVNMSQLNATNAQVAQNTTAIENMANGSRFIAAFQNTGTAASAPVGPNSLAVGQSAVASGNAANAFGSSARATNNGATAVGNSASAGGNNATAIGYGSNASGGNAFAIGTSSAAAAQGSVAMGANAKVNASASSSTALGYGATVAANVTSAVALGASSTNTRSNTVSMGSTGNERQVTNVAAGTADTDAVNVNQLSAATTQLGDQITTVNNNLTTLGDQITAGQIGLVLQAAAGADLTVGAGTDGTRVNFADKDGNTRTLANVSDGIADTDAVNVGQLNTTATQLGDQITTVNNNVTKLGDQISSGQVGLVQQAAAGADLTVGAGTDGARVNFADRSGATRTLANVSAGTAATDAVNVQQLRTELANASASDMAYFQADGWSNKADVAKVAAGSRGVAIGANANATGENSVALGADSVADRDNVVSVGWGMGGNGTRQIINVANGNENTDAVNVQQLKPVIAGLGGGAKIDANTGVVTGPTYNVQGGTQNDVGTALDALDTGLTTAQGDIVNLDGRVTNNETNITNLQKQIGDGSVGLVQQDATTRNITVAAGTDGGVVDFTGTAGARQLTGVADGTVTDGSTDAVNGSQLYATNQQVAKNTGDITTINSNVTALDGRVTTNETNITNLQKQIGDGSVGLVQQDTTTRNITVAAGTDGSVVDLTGTAGARKLTGVANGSDDHDAVNVSQLKQSGLIDNNGNALAAVTYDVNTDGSVNYSSVTLGGQNAAGPVQLHNVADGTAETDAVNLRQLKQAGLVDNNGNTLDAVTYDAGSNRTQVTFGNAGAPVLLSNVQAGMADTDAANVGQLRGLASGLGGGAGIGADGAYIAPSYTFNDVTYNNVGDALSGLATQIGQTGDRITTVEKVISTGESNAHVATSGDQANAASATGGDAVAIGAGASASNTNSVALGAGSTTDRDNTVSVGSAGSERAITNVADAVMSTDAVNKRTMDTAVAGAKSYTDQQIGMVQQALGDVSRKAYSGIAGATALTMIPDVDQGKTIAVGVGVGSYQGYAASAIGVSARLNDRIKVKMGASVSGAGTTYGAGASYQW
ncbi:YadA-like family protein [Ralstonia flaminis]|jgi:autotransporter adhesin|uniref:Adhesin n=1 Tax=Ralstonia flaminis TaxID=3058597 RepID=A0ABM9K160_9RALS|nr:YadA-like family protein [Ralstonia sp. LMG 18101]CAJ0809787.1 hypothetical protein LMG18101_00667 [Ralstonia sp. LMG 18101]